MRKALCVAAAVVAVSGLTLSGQQPPAQGAAAPPGQATPPPASATNLGSDANGNPLRRALKTGHVSNYDEAKVAPYTLPDPLVLADGKPVADAGRVAHAAASRDSAAVRDRDLRPHAGEDADGDVAGDARRIPQARDGAAVMKRVVGRDRRRRRTRRRSS